MYPRPQPQPEPAPPNWWDQHHEQAGSWLISVAVHVVALLLLALLILPQHAAGTSGGSLTINTEVAGEQPLETLLPAELNSEQDREKAPLATSPAAGFAALPEPALASRIDSLESTFSQPVESLTGFSQKLPGTSRGGSSSAVVVASPKLDSGSGDLLQDLLQKGDFAGRTPQGRAVLTKAYGGTPASEAAVDAGLEWLKRHQNPDGSWSFNHIHEGCDYSCTDPGLLVDATVAATSLAMLCFASAGHTHEEGPYQQQMTRGLAFLKQEAEKSSIAGDMRQVLYGSSGMYAQGLATMLLCELHGMTRDEEVGEMAQSCIQFVLTAQNPYTGGWRYVPQDPRGDTSVAGWEIMALVSGKMSRLKVPFQNLQLAGKFLDSVQLEKGAFYGYTSPQKRPSTTAIGLLCRMYLGWKREQLPLKKGVQFLSQLGPARDDMYYNYYATQVMHHWGGGEWRRWNAVMREQLVSSQVKQGHGQGSWMPRDPHGPEGGRHYMTCLAILTLEVYYRHLPLYQDRAAKLDGA